jgi:ribosomal-protein-alanine N-acetyltransferase
MNFSERLNGFPVIETKRLILREIRPEEDAGAFFRLTSDPEVMRYLPWKGKETVAGSRKMLEELRDMFYNNRCINWAIALKDDSTMIGGIRYFFPLSGRSSIGEIGYELARVHWNRGFMTEAVRTLVAFGFERMDLHRIQITTHPENMASRKVALKAGFLDEGVLRQWEHNEVEQVWEDSRMFSRLRSEHS